MRGISLQVFVNYPTTEEGAKLFLDNLAIFKANLLLRSIENLNIDDKAKDEILDAIFEILENKSQDDTI